MSFEYFYAGDEYEFAFYRIPKELVKDPVWQNITMEAKVLLSVCWTGKNFPGRTAGMMMPEGSSFITRSTRSVRISTSAGKKQPLCWMNWKIKPV